jgi:hypothetical protein
MPFVKLDCGILDSSIWIDRPARELFITALLMAEPTVFDEPQAAIEVRSLKKTGFVVPAGCYGIVRAAGIGIIRRAGLNDTEQGIKALERLASPEDDSRSREWDGRRLVRVNGGFCVLNFDRYRKRDATAAERMKRYRDKQKDEIVTRNERNATRNVTPTLQKQKQKQKQKKDSIRMLEREFDTEFWPEYPKRLGNNPKKAARGKYVSRRKGGVPKADMLDGAVRYRKYCEAADQVGTKFVLMAQTWLGERTEGWTQEWTAPKQRTDELPFLNEIAL